VSSFRPKRLYPSTIDTFAETEKKSDPSARLHYPQNKKFAFTIIDDTDNSTVKAVEPVYDLLYSLRLRTTKTAWVYPPRGRFTGDCLLDTEYLAFIRRLMRQGFEVAMHNVGDGAFTRAEIAEGLEIWRRLLGTYPRIQINHSQNLDNIYWGPKRFSAPLSWIYLAIQRHSQGDDPDAQCFWGDLAKKHITYIRNLTFNHINTAACDPRMPYSVRSKAKSANLWFSSSDGETAEDFVRLLSPTNLDTLERDGGVSIVYTHFASGFVKDGEVAAAVRERLEDLASRPGWFVPAGVILDRLQELHETSDDPGYWYRLRLDTQWAVDRVWKRLQAGC
jgi:hypothetical protein